MRKLLILVLVTITLQAFPQKYVLVWSDEFNTPGLPDSTKWSYEEGMLRNNELQYYTSKRLENARIEDSVLILEARKENFEGSDYTSASIRSKNTGDWKYGKFEIRAKVPAGKGTWPALWMLPTNNEYGEWPKSGEIDIMEYIGVEPQNIFYTTHFQGTGSSGHESSGSGATNSIQNPWEQFIKFTLIWTPEKMEWYANDIKYHTYAKPADDYRVWPFDKEFYLILNLAYGGNWGGYAGVDDSKLPHKFLIDYVRVYQLQDTTGSFSLSIEPVQGGSVEISPQLDVYPEGTEVTLTAIPNENNAFIRWQYLSGANPYTFIINKNTTITPVFNNINEVLSNNSFDNDWKPWTFYVENSQNSTYTAEVNNGKFVIDITKSPGVDWQLGFQELEIPMKKGKYSLSFDVFADEPNSLLITISKNYPDWGAIVSKQVSVSTSDKNYVVPIEMPVDDENTRLYFGIGNFTGKFTIDNISLLRINDSATNVKQDDDLNNKWLIYPNPATNNLKIIYSGIGQDILRDIRIYSVDGELVQSIRTQSGTTNINLTGIIPGIYILSINDSNSAFTKKLVIQ